MPHKKEDWKDGLYGHEVRAKIEEFAALTDGTAADCSEISYDRLAEELAIRWPAPDETADAGYRYYGTEGGSWEFPTPSGRARFAGGTGREQPEPPDEEYPLTLTTAREADGYNTGVRSRSAPEEPDPLVARLHPETIETHSVGPGETERVWIASRRGEVTAEIDADEAIPPGIVWLPIHHPATNELTVPATDPDSDEPNFKQCAVRLAPVETSAVLAESGRAD